MAIVDQFGRPIADSPERLELSVRTHRATSRDRASLGSILTNITPGRIREIFAEADNGYPGRQVELAEDIRERDDQVATMCQIRTLQLTALDINITAGDESVDAKKAAEEFKQQWEANVPEQVVERMMEAILDQWHVERVLWDSDRRISGRRRYWMTSIEEVDTRQLAWPNVFSSEPGDITPIIPGIMRNWSPADLEPMAAGKYLWHNYRAKRGRPGKMALVRAIAVYFMFKRFSLTDMAALLEQWGRPWPAVTYDDRATPDEVQIWLDRFVESMSDRVLALPAGAKLDISDPATGADTPHLNMIEACNQAISKVIIGSTTIADAASNNDSVSSPTHGDVRKIIRNADAKAVAASINRNLLIPWTLWNYGAEVAPPVLGFVIEDKPDSTTRAQVFVHAQTLGLTVESEQVYSDMGLKKPKEVPDVLKLQPAASGLGSPFGSLFGGASGVDGASGRGGEGEKKPEPPSSSTGETPVPHEQEVEVLPELVLNGAQIQAAVAIVKSVAMGEMPRDAGVGQLIVLFNLKPEQAEQIMGSAGTSTPTTPNPRPASPGMES